MSRSGVLVTSDGQELDDLLLHRGELADISDVDLKQARFAYLAHVDTTRVPLYLAISRALYVQDDTKASIWLKEQIMETWANHGITEFSEHTVKNLGVLVQATGFVPIQAISTEHDVTEVLFYAEPKGTWQTNSAESSMTTEDIQIRALPLSSHLLYADANFPTVPQSEPEPIYTLSEPPNQQAPKHNDLNAIFDSAADLRRKRRNGGSSIGLAASRGISQPHSPPIKPEPEDEPKSIENQDRSLPNVNVLQGRHRRRSPPFAAGKAASPTAMKPPSRPSSRTGPERKRSSLSTVQTPQDSSFDARNRQTITKTVMAGMRMYGLQQRKGGESQLNGESMEAAGSEEEYKLVYHQTFKGAVFALRREMDLVLVRPDAVREVVDRLLAVFCGEMG